MARCLTKKEIITRVRKIHKNKFDYSKINYKDNRTKILIFCKKHKKWFYSSLNNHLQGGGCYWCKKENYNKAKLKWTRTRCIKLLKRNKYKTIIELQKKYINLYIGIWTYHKDLLSIYFPNKLTQRTEKEITLFINRNKIIKRQEFKKLNKNLYQAAYRRFRPILDMLLPSTKVLFNFEMVKKIASNYKYRVDFRNGDSGAYAWCLRNKCLDKVCKHMKIKSNLFRRVLYKYVFSRKRIYIGITANPRRRDWDHRSKSGKHHGLLRRYPEVKMNILKKNLTPKQAIKKEEDLIQYYRKIGWSVLNDKSPRRSLGYVKVHGKVFDALNYKNKPRPE